MSDFGFREPRVSGQHLRRSRRHPKSDIRQPKSSIMVAVDNQFSPLEKSILTAKGLTAAQLDVLIAVGVASRQDLQTVGDAGTLMELVREIDAATAAKVMEWVTGRATPAPAAQASTSSVIIDSADIVHCCYCSARQPKDYKSGDLCLACRNQPEPVLTPFC